MKRSRPLPIATAVILAALYFGNPYLGGSSGSPPATAPGANPAASTPASDLAALYAARRGDTQVSGEGTVVRVLADDNEGSRHQRFILDVGGGHTVLVAHNIDLAPRIAGLERGDRVGFNGEYEWNERGGVVHWTHHDPQGRHEDGWLKHDGRTYR